ncbi:MAG: hypothetical protein IIA89_09835 [Chloroflexi bacterium]|nr:hypothetical protein [Chloroflexota bacterium]
MFKNLLRKKHEPRGHDYFAELAEVTKNPDRLEEVREALESQGFWEDSYEWRIFSEMQVRIEAVEKDSRQWFRVSVKSDHEFRCHAQTIERAAFFSALYQELIIDMYYNLGWASSSPATIKEHEKIFW